MSIEPVAREKSEEAEAITLEATCPEDGVAGDILSVQIGHEDDGEESMVDVQIPEGVQSGETFEVHVARRS